MFQVLETIGRYSELAHLAGQEPVNGAVFCSPRSRVPILITHRGEGRAVSDRVAWGDGSLRHRILVVSDERPGIVTTCTPFPSGKRGINVELTMYFEGGVNLYSYLQNLGGMSPIELMRIMTPAVSGLAYLHEVGLVHRDIKPSNILVTHGKKGDSAKLADLETTDWFGETHNIVRTPLYAPPEAFPSCGRPQPITPAHDVFCLGVTMSEMLVSCAITKHKILGEGGPIDRERGQVYVSDGELNPSMKEALARSFPGCAENLLDTLGMAVTRNPSTRPSVLAFWNELGSVFKHS